jgi:hypothetical protein
MTMCLCMCQNITNVYVYVYVRALPRCLRACMRLRCFARPHAFVRMHKYSHASHIHTYTYLGLQTPAAVEMCQEASSEQATDNATILCKFEIKIPTNPRRLISRAAAQIHHLAMHHTGTQSRNGLVAPDWHQCQISRAVDAALRRLGTQTLRPPQ